MIRKIQNLEKTIEILLERITTLEIENEELKQKLDHNQKTRRYIFPKIGKQTKKVAANTHLTSLPLYM